MKLLKLTLFLCLNSICFARGSVAVGTPVIQGIPSNNVNHGAPQIVYLPGRDNSPSVTTQHPPVSAEAIAKELLKETRNIAKDLINETGRLLTTQAQYTHSVINLSSKTVRFNFQNTLHNPNYRKLISGEFTQYKTDNLISFSKFEKTLIEGAFSSEYTPCSIENNTPQSALYDQNQIIFDRISTVIVIKDNKTESGCRVLISTTS